MPGPPPARKPGPPVALIIIAVVVLLVGGGGGAYLATISGGAYATLPWACTLLPVTDAATLVPHGLHTGVPPGSGDSESDCAWSNLTALNAGLEKESVHLTVRAHRKGRDLLFSAEKNAHDYFVSSTTGSPVRSPGTPISG